MFHKNIYLAIKTKLIVYLFLVLFRVAIALIYPALSPPPPPLRKKNCLDG